jgi:hypothetical protein
MSAPTPSRTVGIAMASQRSSENEDIRSVALNISTRELMFLQKVVRQDYSFITDDECDARMRLRNKLVEGFYDSAEKRMVLNLTREELLFLIKVARERYTYIATAERTARLALAERLHQTYRSVFGASPDQWTPPGSEAL